MTAYHWLSIRSGPGRIRTCNQAVMHPTTAFAAPFRFVGWTISSPTMRGCLPFSLYTFLVAEAWLGITLPSGLGFPEFDRCHLKIAPQAARCGEPYHLDLDSPH